MDMCRFSGPDDVEYRKVVGALNRVLEATAKWAPPGVRSVLSADERRIYLDSLRFDQIDARHATIKTARAGACRWLLGTSEYQDWLEINKISEHHGFLWIKGKPGTGKSTLMKFAYANAKETMTDTIIISFFFNARGELLEKSTFGMYRSLLVQLLEKVPELQSLFDFLGSTAPNNGDLHRWNIEMVKDIFGRAINNLGSRCLTCFIDALDECEEDEVREMVAFFEYLGQLTVSSRIRFHVCFSSRHYPYITIEKGVQLILEGQEGHRQDIANYLHSELKAERSKLVDQIKAEILDRASGIFLWVVLVVQVLNREYADGHIHQLRKRLSEIPDGLDNLFKDILTKDGRNMEELILCLQWILYAKRPLKREELYYAILAGGEPEAVTVWNSEDITKQDMERFILSSSKGLAEVTKSKTVQFIHESVRDFLLNGNGLNRIRPGLRSNFPGQSHETMAHTVLSYSCLSYLLQGFLDAGPCIDSFSLYRRLQTYRLASYSSYFFSSHLCQISEVPKELEKLLKRFLSSRSTAFAAIMQLRALCGRGYDITMVVTLFTTMLQEVDASTVVHSTALMDHPGLRDDIKGLLLTSTPKYTIHQAVGAGLLNNAAQPIQKGYQVDEGDPQNKTLLYHASRNGDREICDYLLKRGANVAAKTDDGKTALYGAAVGGHEAVVRLLLEDYKADVRAKTDDGLTVLHAAAACGHEAVVRLLLEDSKADVEAKADGGWTVLHSAVVGGNEAVVRMLLEDYKADVEVKADDGWTVLHSAAVGRNKAVVRLLLEKYNIDVEAMADDGWTVLHWAAGGGHEAVVRLLLEDYKADVEAKDSDGRTALHWAAGDGHETVVRLLLEEYKADVEAKDSDGTTALHMAMEKGHEAAVQVLKSA
jgi:ankyrin repeat protein